MGKRRRIQTDFVRLIELHLPEEDRLLLRYVRLEQLLRYATTTHQTIWKVLEARGWCSGRGIHVGDRYWHWDREESIGGVSLYNAALIETGLWRDQAHD